MATKTPEEIVLVYGIEVALLFRLFCDAAGVPDTPESRELKDRFEKQVAEVGDKLLGRGAGEGS